ncbi:MAG: SpoIID/LytB domain-containing protein [Thermodesulfobacteriota bacterium]
MKTKKGCFTLTLIPLVLFFAMLCLPCRAEAGKSVRVLVLRGPEVLNIERDLEGGDIIIRRLAGTEKVLMNHKERALPQTFSPMPSFFLYLNKRPYRGRLVIHADPASRDGLLVVDELDIEEYIAGIINYEISSAWPREAVKAQAVAARTYMLHRMERALPGPYDIEGSTSGQVYRGAAAEDEASLRAVRECGGEVLLFDGKPALTVYHSNSGGRTDAAGDIWTGGGGAEEYPYLRSVPSSHDGDADPRYRWDFALSAASLKRVLQGEGFNIGSPRRVRLDDLTPGGRVRRVRIIDDQGRTLTIRGEEFRRLIGYSIVRSAVFTVRREGGLFIFRGRGSGHGVGMSQWGARGMAEAGASYREILRHYYPGARLKKLF